MAPVPFPERQFKFVPSPSSEATPFFHPGTRSDADAISRAVRTRRGRGGVLRVDRRTHRLRPTHLQFFDSRSTSGDKDDNLERDQRLRERWMFDEDDGPAYGPDGTDEQDRVLVEQSTYQ